MLLSDFDYELPDRLIAGFPAGKRRDSRLLVVDAENDLLEDRRFRDLPTYLHAGDRLVLNDTRVIKARLIGKKTSGGNVEALIERITSDRTALSHLRASKSPKTDTRLEFPGGYHAVVRDRDDDLYALEFSSDLEPLLEAHGSVPLPPYLGRDADPSDDQRYQTVYAREPGAVAAPTAGLHFDHEMLNELRAAGIDCSFVTLHVGAGTFQSLRHSAVDENRLHAERIEIDARECAAINKTRSHGGRLIAVGTTSVRVLESAFLDGEVRECRGETDLFVRPGYRFRAVDVLLTNFHLPRSSLLMLVAALAGRERILEAYRHAVASEYRFFSYGDAMLILPPGASR